MSDSLITTLAAHLADVADLENEVGKVLGHLASAYGGYSQFTTADITCAIAGHHRNGGSLSRFPTEELVREFARQDARRWEDCGADAAMIEAEIWRGTTTPGGRPLSEVTMWRHHSFAR